MNIRPEIQYDEQGKVIPELHFGFILNFLYLSKDITLPIEVIEGHDLDRATSEQVHFIDEALQKNLPGRQIRPVKYMYMNNYEVRENSAWSLQELDESNWKYFVINNKRPEIGNQAMIDLTNCFFLAKRIRLALQVWGTRAVGKADMFEFKDPMLNYFSKVYNVPIYIEPISVDIRMLQNIRVIYERYTYIMSKGTEFKFILDAIDYYRQSDAILDQVKIKTLEYFALLELLLTHNPVDKGDSLTRQLVSKTQLIINRFEVPTILTDFFSKNTAPLSTIIKKMYDLRSAVAHGNTIDFQKELSILKNQESANSFLTFLLENTILLSLKEPQLIKDLKEC